MPSSLSISPPRETSRTETCPGPSLESPLPGVAGSGDGQQQGLDRSSSVDEPAGIEITQVGGAKWPGVDLSTQCKAIAKDVHHVEQASIEPLRSLLY